MNIPTELQYLDKLIRFRMGEESQPDAGKSGPKMPPYDKWELPLGQFATDNELTPDEARLLLIGLAHNLQPDLFDVAIDSMLKGASEFPKIGGTRGKNFRGFLPTGETALFLLAGDDWTKRLEVQKLFWAEHFFAAKKILWLEEVPQGEPTMSGKIILSQDHIDIFTYGKTVPPHFRMSFPAKRVTTQLNWEHLVINNHLNSQINDLLDWMKFNDTLHEKDGEGGRFRNGYRALFYGPPGTGKTFTASLLGKTVNKEVYRIDLSMVVSKYIGETEKNLELLFARAENKGWILFFDEADALFGKRTNVRDAHDKYANQEVSYLLQRIEDYDGLVILATNMKNNIDDAFIRRFNAILKFPMPDPEERKSIWQKTFLPGTKFEMKLPEAEALTGSSASAKSKAPAGEEDVPDITELVKKYELSGGNILNIVHYASIKGAKRMDAAANKKTKKKQEGLTIYLPDLIDGIKRELSKDNIPFI